MITKIPIVAPNSETKKNADAARRRPSEDCDKEKMSAKQGVDVLKAKVALLPLRSGVYRMLDKDGKVLYVGKAKGKAKVHLFLILNNLIIFSACISTRLCNRFQYAGQIVLFHSNKKQ